MSLQLKPTSGWQEKKVRNITNAISNKYIMQSMMSTAILSRCRRLSQKESSSISAAKSAIPSQQLAYHGVWVGSKGPISWRRTSGVPSDRRACAK